MRVILAGQKSFGAEAYAMLKLEGHEVVDVWAPDDGRDKLARAAARDFLLAPPISRIPERVEGLDADLFVCAHSHDFISRASREATRLGGIGYHPSLLPRHRGRDAVRWTVHLGDPIAGGSVYWLTENIDGGPIAAQDWCFVPKAKRHEDQDDVVSRLWREELFPMGIRLLAKVLRDLDNGVLVEVAQDEDHATWEPSWDRPPLFRPDLIQIGRGVNGFEHVVTRER